MIWRRNHDLLESQNQLLQNILDNDPELSERKKNKRKDADNVMKNTKKMKTTRNDNDDDLKRKIVLKTKKKEDKRKRK